MASARRRLKDAAKSSLLLLHKAMLRAGLVVLPNHYYTPIADLRRLKQTRGAWARRASMAGIDADVGQQIAVLRERVLPFQSEYLSNARYREGVAAGFGPGYGYVEAQCLHGMIRWLKPKRIVEVGSGVSTHVMLGALELNGAEGRPGRMTCIEPFPSPYLRGSSAIDLLDRPVEALDPATFNLLDEGDFLFIDSTHAVRPGGDVVHLYLQVLPRLKAGVTIHIHDIYFPYLHQRDLLTSLFQHEETALLAALLTGNRSLSVIACLSLLHYDAPEALRELFPEYRREPDDGDGLSPSPGSGHFPSSIYLLTA